MRVHLWVRMTSPHSRSVILFGDEQIMAGELRWRAPQPPDDVVGVQNATVMPNECVQAAVGVSGTNPFEPQSKSLAKRDVTASEDCLFLK